MGQAVEALLHGQQVIEHCKHTLFDFAGIASAANQNMFFGKINDHKLWSVGADYFGFGQETRRMKNIPFGFKRFQFRAFGRNKHIARKKTGPRLFRNKAKEQ